MTAAQKLEALGKEYSKAYAEVAARTPGLAAGLALCAKHKVKNIGDAICAEATEIAVKRLAAA